MYAFKFDAYYRSLQWRFYLDMTGRDHFRYIGLHIRNPIKKAPDDHRLTAVDELDCYAYAGMTDELTDKVERFAAFVDHECPEYWDIDIYAEGLSYDAKNPIAETRKMRHLRGCIDTNSVSQI